MAGKNSWKDYLTFSKKERNGFLIVLVAAGIVIAYPFLKNRNKEKMSGEEDKALSQVDTSHFFAAEEEENPAKIYKVQPEKLTAFDPNTISREEWLAFGLSPKTASTIINYISKGGKFYKPEDIRKIWGMQPEDADKLIPYIRINGGHTAGGYNKNSYGNGSRVSPVDVNTADAAAFKTLPGIGDVLSERIVKYRTAVHGFSDIQEIKKVYGISEATFNSILPYLTLSASASNKPMPTPKEEDAPEIATVTTKAGKVNINKATEKEMTAAGIPRNIAKAIKVYRDQHGTFKTSEDLKKIIFINDATYEQILPLLLVE